MENSNQPTCGVLLATVDDRQAYWPLHSEAEWPVPECL